MKCALLVSWLVALPVAALPGAPSPAVGSRNKPERLEWFRDRILPVSARPTR